MSKGRISSINWERVNELQSEMSMRGYTLKVEEAKDTHAVQTLFVTIGATRSDAFSLGFNITVSDFCARLVDVQDTTSKLIEKFEDSQQGLYGQNGVFRQLDLSISDVSKWFLRVRNEIDVVTNNYCSIYWKIPNTDLAAVPYVAIEIGGDGSLASARIPDDIMNNANYSYDQLAQNTIRMFPTEVTSFNKLVIAALARTMRDSDISEEIGDMAGTSEIKVITNTAGINGATNCFVSDVLESLGSEYGWILPSSIHEVIFIGDGTELDFNGLDVPSSLKQIVSEVNTECIARCEWLSDKIYYWSREEGFKSV